MQGTFLHVHRPFYRYPNQTLKNNRDNSPYDLESLRSDELPITAFKPIVPLGEFTARYNQRASGQPFSSAFRIAWRAMADNVGRRTLMCAIIPPGPTHVHGIGSLALTTDDPRQLLILAALLGSLQADFFVRAAPKSTIPGHVISRIPAPSIPRALEAEAIARVLRLNALTHEWAPIYDYAWPTNEHQVGWSVSGLRLAPLGGVLDKWSRAVPLRTDEERYQAEMELDVIAAISLRLGVEDLLGLYRSQFPVLFSRDAKTVFNGSGRAAVGRAERTTMSMAVAAPGGGGEAACLSQQGLQRPLDRSADMRLAYSHFQRVVREHS